MRQRENSLYLVYKIVRRLSFNWRALNGAPNLMAMVVTGEVFKDGVLEGSDSELEVMPLKDVEGPEGNSTPIDKGSRNNDSASAISARAITIRHVFILRDQVDLGAKIARPKAQYVVGQRYLHGPVCSSAIS